MRFYRTPALLQKFFPDFTWKKAGDDNSLYITFDDGPHPGITPWVVDELGKRGASATFFCLGKNVVENPGVVELLRQNGHTVANHSHNHIRGWDTRTKKYVHDVQVASRHINSTLFRPPYGRITLKQAKVLKRLGYDIVMWSVLSYDFDKKLPVKSCMKALQKTKAGDIIVFHDSAKAYSNLKLILPELLDCWKEQGCMFKSL